jgi:hypothetical protein
MLGLIKKYKEAINQLEKSLAIKNTTEGLLSINYCAIIGLHRWENDYSL